MKKPVQLLLVLFVSGGAGGLLTALYFFEGAAPAGLLSALNWLMAFCGAVFFLFRCVAASL